VLRPLPCDGAWVAEATNLIDVSSWPFGTRLRITAHGRLATLPVP
jgi:hypothetical protein